MVGSIALLAFVTAMYMMSARDNARVGVRVMGSSLYDYASFSTSASVDAAPHTFCGRFLY